MVKVLLVAGWMKAVVGDDVNSVPAKDLAVEALLSGAGVEGCVSQLQALNQQPSLHVEEAVLISQRKLRGREKMLEFSSSFMFRVLG